MNNTLWLIGYCLIAAFVIVYGLWLIVPFIAGLPWYPTRTTRIRKALRLAQLQPGETIYDLGAGDGRVLIIAAREFGARAVGIEISPVHCLVAWLAARFNGVADQVSIRLGNFYTARLDDADVVFAYMTSREAPRIRFHLERQMRPGARLVTISFDFDCWQPDDYDNQDLIFLYKMPPTPGNLTTFLEQKWVT